MVRNPMLVGHFAPAFAIRASTPRVPLWQLVLATQAVDVLFFVLVLAGVEGAALTPDQHPRLVVTQGIWTHSLVATGVAFGVCVLLGWLRSNLRAGMLLGLAVASHWLGDLIVHVPDLPLTLDQSTAVGLGLWRWPILATGLEVGLVILAGGWLYRRYRGPARPRLLGLVAGLVVLQLASDLVVPAPPTDDQLAPMAWLVYALATVAAWWVERPPREPAAEPAAESAS